MAKKRNNYLDNKDFLKEIKYCKENNILSDKLVDFLYAIANKVSSSRNFINYTYKDEMIQESVIHALYKAFPNYDIERSNPFGFFSTVIIYKFIEIIKKENKFLDVKDILKELEQERVDSDTENRI